MYRDKYNLPPNDPRFLELYDEDMVYELVLQKEYNIWLNSEAPDSKYDENTEIFKSDEKQFDDITKRLEAGEDIDLHSIKPEGTWEKI
jgi:hypothetical protein